MTKNDLSYDLLRNVMNKKGYAFYTGELNLNMIGIRSSNRRVNNWDDFFCLVYESGSKKKLWINDLFTTDPGIYYMTKKLLNPLGCGILAEGQYKSMWEIGLHNNKYEAFVQVNKCKTYRDRSLDNFMDFDPTSIQEGLFGCNQHHGYSSASVDNNSAMCQVHKSKTDLGIVLDIAKKSIPMHGKFFTYTLLNESDLK